ncbi:MAG: ABC transporter substrate-binding protein [Pseudomonadota bacterium]
MPILHPSARAAAHIGRQIWAAAAVLMILCGGLGCEPAAPPRRAEHAVPGVTDTEIRIGTSLALGGHASYLGVQTLHGALAYLRHVNDTGGVHGRMIRLVTYDDQYDPPRCVANTQRLIVEDRVFALFSYVGTPTTLKIVPLVEEAKIPLVGMFTGASALREPLSRYLINVRASYYQETAAAVNHLVDKQGLRRIAVFYQYDAYGFDGLRGTELALKNHGLVPVAKGTYIRGTLNTAEGLARIMAADAEAVVMIGTYDPCAEFIKKARAQGSRALFYAVSFVGADELKRKLGADGEGLLVTQVVPLPEHPENSKRLWGVVEYERLLKTYFPSDTPNFVGLEGYLNARVLHEGLRRCGPNLNREAFIDAIETIRDYDLGVDNTLSFSPRDHQGLHQVYLTRLEEGHFVPIRP